MDTCPALWDSINGFLQGFSFPTAGRTLTLAFISTNCRSGARSKHKALMKTGTYVEVEFEIAVPPE